jgi:riboflavin kinase / FMN adenylyltransferase
MPMEILDWDQVPPAACRGGILTIGNFDGVHLGHAALVAEARRLAREQNRPAVALTFDPHPLQLLRPAQFQPVLTTITDRAELLEACGADQVVVLRTSSALLQLTAALFFQNVIRDRLGARALVEGPNFGFGRNREGNVATLGALCRESNLDFVQVPPVELAGKPVSSSRVRNALLQGGVREAAAMLNRPYRLRGTVGTGQARGRTLGFPTANLERFEVLVPGDGVYAVRVHHDQQSWPGAANIGPNPTFGEQARKVEVHLIGFSGDLVGESLAVDFIDRLRSTRPFANVEELKQQLGRDVEQARRLAAP